MTLSSLLIAGLVAAAPAEPAPLRLTRADAVRLGLERNLGLLAQRLDVLRAQSDAAAAWLPYQPALSFDAAWARPNVPLEPLLDYGGAVSWKSTVGTQVSAVAGASQPIAGNTALGNTAALGVTVTQPLLKDAWLRGASLPLEEAALGLSLQRELFRQELEGLLLELEAAYWDLAVATEDVAIKRKSRQRAKDQYDDTQENIRRGILADVELYVVEDNLVFFEQELLRSEESLRAARRRLAERLQLPLDSPLEAAEELRPAAFPLPSPAAAIDSALQRHPAAQAQRLRVELAAARAAHAARQSLPSLDASASVTLRGADSPTAAAWSQIFARPTPDTRVGLSFALPLGRAAVNAEEERARLDLQRAELAQKGVESALRLGVESALSQLSLQLSLSTLAQKQVGLAELKLSAETEKYKSGISRLPEVVRFQRELDSAQLALRRTLRALHLARAQLLHSQGALAKALGVEAAP